MFLWMLCGQVHSKLESLLTYTHPITCHPLDTYTHRGP
jgi:hypothetical protein